MNMMNLSRNSLVWLTAVLLASPLAAQSPVADATRSFKLLNLSQQLQQRDAGNRQQALLHASRMGISKRQELPGGGVLELQRIAPGIGPVFYITNNLDAADTVSTDEIWPGGSAGLNLDGGSMTAALWDGGAVFADHPDFTGRLSQVDGATTVSGHSTHVAGTLAGSGANFYQATGMAYAAQLDAYDWNSDTAEMAAAAAAGQLVSNHSYGIAAGWIYTGNLPPEQWWWIGGQVNTGEDPNFGYYDTETQLWDQIAFDAPYYLIVKAGGNDRTDIGPSPGEEYRVIDQDGNTIEYSTLPRDPDCWPAGYDCLPTNSVAKNILTVGAVDDLYGGYKPAEGPSSVAMADFSSWGPTDDGRIKPDLVGNGMFLYSTWPDNPYYAVAAGTSMAAPNISGSLLLLQQHYENLHGADQFMRAATLKALAIHTADEAGAAPGPDYAFGWGLLNSLKAANAISADSVGGDQDIVEASLSNSATDSWPVNLGYEGGTLTATLVWADPPGTPPAPATDPTNLMLVNDLDLRIVQGGSSWQPWILDPANPSAAASTGDNFRDNVEQVKVSGASAGSYTVQVSHKGSLLDALPQDYSLLIGQQPPPPVSNGFLLDESFDGGVLPPGWSIQTDQGVDWQIMTPQPGHSHFDNLTFGSGPFAIVYNNFARTRTSLRTPVLDLSTHDTAVLRFNSAFPYADTTESLNVDISTNGGTTWTYSVWQWFGFNPWPTHYDIDLTGIITGQSNVMLAFRFDSHGDPQGDTWQVDDVQLEVFGVGPPPGDPPGAATNPQPAIGASDIAIDTDLAWTAGTGVDTHEVYFGLGAPLGPADHVSSQAGVTYDPGTLSYGTTYYWRVDEVNEDGTTPGATWSFATVPEPPPPPGPASSPNIPDGAVDVDVNSILTWSPAATATMHDVYLGLDASLDAGDLRSSQVGTSYDPGTLAYSTTYYWRIDEINAGGTTTGPVWSFTTAAAPPSDIIHVSGFEGVANSEPRNRWSAAAQIGVSNQDSLPEPGVTVEGTWSNGASGSGNCLTSADGSCSVIKNNLKANVSSVEFTITNLAKAGQVYDPAANSVPSSLQINQGNQDAQPLARDDSYSTETNIALSANVQDNDDPGDGPALIESHTTPSSGNLALAADGAFTYTPDTGFEGSDSFTYRLVDQDGDLSGFATVNLSVTSNPPPSGDPSVSATPYKIKGIQHVTLQWQDFNGNQVDVRRDGTLLPGSPWPNPGSLEDNLGVKGGGQTYLYEVCETGTSTCASALASF